MLSILYKFDEDKLIKMAIKKVSVSVEIILNWMKLLVGV